VFVVRSRSIIHRSNQKHDKLFELITASIERTYAVVFSFVREVGNFVVRMFAVVLRQIWNWERTEVPSFPLPTLPSPFRCPSLASFLPFLPLEVRPLNQLWGLGSAVSSPSGVWGGAETEIEFGAF